MAPDKYRALVLEDEEAIQMLVARALRKQAFQCDIAADGAVAS